MMTKFRTLTAVLVVLFIGSILAPIGTATLAAPPDKKKKTKDGDKKKPAKKKPVRGFNIGPREVSHYEIDMGAEGNEVKFTSAAPKETIIGKSSQISGTLDANPHALKDAKGRFAVAWSSLDTGKPTMNQHMTSPPWVDAGAHPDIVFTMDGMTGIKAGDKRGAKLRCILTGTFALNGGEKKMKIPATLEYVAPSAGKKKPKHDDSDSDNGDSPKEGIRIKANFFIGLADFGISGKAVGDKVAAKQKIAVSLFLPLKAKPEETKPDAQPIKPRGPRIRRPGS
ncbi:MAG: YceI family protein [Planctomycetes bacterium]|nr:YceI family protein [Planctomycetota bacterium]